MTRNLNRVFYIVIVGVSIAGATQSTQQWLDWWLPFALIAVATIELGGITLAAHADRRRRMGERAIPARLLSGAVAAGAMAVNFFGHADLGPAVFFTGATATGYCVWLIDSAAARRDALRAEGKLPPVLPVYGVMAWLRHFSVTYRARQLAMVAPELDRASSLLAARESLRAERRTAATTAALRKRIADHVDPTMATIAVNTFDIDRVVAGLAAGADYAGLTSLLAAELLPARLHRPTEGLTPEIAAEPVADPELEQLQARFLAASQTDTIRVLDPERVERAPRSTWDAHGVVRMILDGESNDMIIKETGASYASVGRIRKVTNILKLDRTAKISANEKVRADIVGFIRQEVSK